MIISSEDQTLVLYSGHPLGLFPSSPAAPRAIITNGMVIPNYSSRYMFIMMMFRIILTMMMNTLTVMMLILMTVMTMTVMTTTLMIREEYDRMFALGVSMYGQMTAGSYCYIGPQVTIIVMMMMLIGEVKMMTHYVH